MNRNSGFTLVEILAVLVIIGILAGIGIPKYFDLQQDALIQAAQSARMEAQARINMVFASHILHGGDCSKIGISTRNTSGTITTNNNFYQYGIADSGSAQDKGTVGGWIIEMGSDNKISMQTHKEHYIIWRLTAPSGEQIVSDANKSYPGQSATNADALRVPDARFSEMFYLYLPACIR